MHTILSRISILRKHYEVLPIDDVLQLPSTFVMVREVVAAQPSTQVVLRTLERKK